MKATEAKLLDFIKKSPQFVIPIYQRTYSWTEKECKQLWDDIIRAGKDDAISVHFVGSIVYIEQGLSQVTHQSPLLVIDGQQRLTTATLLLAALAEAVGDTEPAEGFSAAMLKGYYLLNPLEKEERRFKLLLSQTDKQTLKAIVDDQELPPEPSLRVQQNYELFKELLAKCDNDYLAVCRGLAKLVVVDIALNRDQDNPQLIFESMNSTGKELSQADLIRNYILMGLEHDLQTRLYEQFWRPMENEFGQEAYGSHFDSFMRHYLTVKTGEIPRIKEVYEAFKAHACSPEIESAGVAELVKDVREYSRYFCSMALGREKNPELKRAFDDLRELKVDVAYPLLLELYRDYSIGILTDEDLCLAVRFVEAYVFRRAICAIPTNSLNMTFAKFTNALDKERYIESFKHHLFSLKSYRRFPRDDEFKRELSKRDLYNFRSRSYWLRRMENYGRKELVPVAEYTIEHLMPQNENLSARWQEELGSDWQRIHEQWLHTLGNLTLTAYNSEYSDRPFLDKRDMPTAPEKGLKQSPLKLNQGLGVIERWDETAIVTRAKRLAELATKVWEAPVLSQDILETFGSLESKRVSQYNIDDHPFLSTAQIQPLYEAFRRSVLALDPCVTEEFLKLYVAFKAETNFCDVVPQAKALRISINMCFRELDDPRGLCIDVTNKGRWGNGDVEVKLTSLDQLPYIMGFVRQALDIQLGSNHE